MKSEKLRKKKKISDRFLNISFIVVLSLVLAIVAGLLIWGAVAIFHSGTDKDESSEAADTSGAAVARSSTALVALTDLENKGDSLFFLTYIDYSGNAVPVAMLPPEAAVTSGGYTGTLAEQMRYGGTPQIVPAVEELCGIEISKYAVIGYDSLASILDENGGLAFDVPEAIDIAGVGGGTFTLDQGEQTLTGNMVTEILRYYGKSSDREKAHGILLGAVTEIVNQLLTADNLNGESIFTYSVNAIDTNISFRDYANSKEQLLELVGVNDQPAKTLELQGSYRQEGSKEIFEADDSSLRELTDMFSGGQP